MAYSKYKHSAERAQSDKVLRKKSFTFTNNPKYDGYTTINGKAIIIHLVVELRKKRHYIK